jgi:intein-encoded DNA endonuclease-like protein
LAYWGEVKELKTDGMGFRPIADYLTSKRKLKVSATYLSKLWKEVEG